MEGYERYKTQLAAGGIGRPGWLKYDKTGLFDRRIDEVNRPVY